MRSIPNIFKNQLCTKIRIETFLRLISTGMHKVYLSNILKIERKQDARQYAARAYGACLYMCHRRYIICLSNFLKIDTYGDAYLPFKLLKIDTNHGVRRNAARACGAYFCHRESIVNLSNIIKIDNYRYRVHSLHFELL
jgi:hypothetical protein